jgi:hypothetical protein
MTEKHLVSATDEPAVNAPVAKSLRRTRDPARPAATPHTHRFRMVTGLLVGLAIGAVLVAVAIGAHGRQSRPSVTWSSWTPPDSGTLGARDIADYVAPLYRISPVDQLAVVTVVNLESTAASQAAAAAEASGSTPTASSSGLQVAVRPSPTSSAVSLLTGNTIAYNLCGIGGKGCAIGVGTPSSNRLLLLRREALELALYTFKYISGVQNVVAILPPGRTVTTGTLSKSPPKANASASKPVDMAVLFEHDELSPLLNTPLADTLPGPVPPTLAQMPTAPEAGLVDQITARGLFSEQLQQAQDGSNLIVLNPLPPQ